MWGFEYLKSKDAPNAPRPAAVGPAGRGGLFAHGHRLSSLYRAAETGGLWLTPGYGAPSLLEKYSAGVRGCETPAADLATGGHA